MDTQPSTPSTTPLQQTPPLNKNVLIAAAGMIMILLSILGFQIYQNFYSIPQTAKPSPKNNLSLSQEVQINYSGQTIDVPQKLPFYEDTTLRRLTVGDSSAIADRLGFQSTPT